MKSVGDKMQPFRHELNHGEKNDKEKERVEKGILMFFSYFKEEEKKTRENNRWQKIFGAF